MQRLSGAQITAEERPVDVRSMLHHFATQLALLLERGKVGIDDLARVIAIVRFRPVLREPGLRCHLVLERIRAPAGAIVELEPLIGRPALRVWIVRKESGMRGRISWAKERMVRVPARGIDRNAI